MISEEKTTKVISAELEKMLDYKSDLKRQIDDTPNRDYSAELLRSYYLTQGAINALNFVLGHIEQGTFKE